MFKNFSICFFIVFIANIIISTAADAQNIKVDSNLPDYRKVSAVGGNLNSIGSDTLNNLMTFWAEDFRKIYPNVNIQIEGKGSATAPPALLEGTAQLGPMSRAMKKEELNSLKKKYGYEPIAIGVALDALSAFVHKSNPLNKLTLQEVDAIFSITYKGGLNDIDVWGKVINQAKWKNSPIRLYGRNSASGTYGYFKSKALFKGDFKSSVKERPGSAAVVQSVSEDVNGIGYSGVGYLTTNVKALSLAKKKGSKYYAPNYDNVLSGNYPLARLLYVYLLKDPNKPLDKLVSEFIKFVLSKAGQKIVVKDGYLPLTKGIIDSQLKKLN